MKTKEYDVFICLNNEVFVINEKDYNKMTKINKTKYITISTTNSKSKKTHKEGEIMKKYYRIFVDLINKTQEYNIIYSDFEKEVESIGFSGIIYSYEQRLKAIETAMYLIKKGFTPEKSKEYFDFLSDKLKPINKPIKVRRHTRMVR